MMWTSLKRPIILPTMPSKDLKLLKLLAEIILICFLVYLLIKQVSRGPIKHPHFLGSNPGFQAGQGCHVG